jgi:DHA1 family bicyclomycin/chloramphenicol resistance-like MFS transporter
MNDSRSPALPSLSQHTDRPLLLGAVLTGLTAFGPLSTDLYLPALPGLVNTFQTDIATVQLTLSVFLAAFAVSMLIYGPLSDQFGRRPVLLAGLGVYVLASVFCMMAESIEQLIFARFIQAVGACASPVISRAVVRDLFERRRAAQMLSYMAMAMGLAPAVGPMIGGVLAEHFGWQACFAVLGLYAVVCIVVVLTLLPETNRFRGQAMVSPRLLFHHYRRLFKHREFMVYVICASSVFSGIFSYVSGSSFVLIDHHQLSPMGFGLCFTVFVMGYMLGTFTSGRLNPVLGIDQLIRRGTAIAALAGVIGMILAATGVDHVAAVVGPMALFMVGAGMTLPNAQAGAVGPFPEIAGMASSLLGFIQMGAAAITGGLVGHLHDGGPIPMMVAVGIAALAGAISFRWLVGADQIEQERS